MASDGFSGPVGAVVLSALQATWNAAAPKVMRRRIRPCKRQERSSLEIVDRHIATPLRLEAHTAATSMTRRETDKRAQPTQFPCPARDADPAATVAVWN